LYILLKKVYILTSPQPISLFILSKFAAEALMIWTGGQIMWFIYIQKVYYSIYAPPNANYMVVSTDEFQKIIQTHSPIRGYWQVYISMF
jgi:hypothetical protein